MPKYISILLIIAVAFAYSVGWADVRRSTLDTRLSRSEESFENVLNSKVGPIPPAVLSRAQGILIFREYGAGFVFGGKGGFGVAMARRRNGEWGAPAFLKAGEGSFGLQIGVQRLDLVFLFMNRDSMRVFEGGQFRIGVDVGAAAGPVGANAEAKIGAPVLVYSDTAGLYAGAKFEGGVLLPDDEANVNFYNSPRITVPEILYNSRIQPPPAAEGLRRELQDYERGRMPNYHHRNYFPEDDDEYDRNEYWGGRR